MTVRAQKKLTLPLILGILLLVAAAVFGAGKYMESTQIKRLNEAIARIPANYGFRVGSVEGSLFGRSLTLNKVAFTLPSDTANASVTMESVAVEGISFEGLAAPGMAALADAVTITGMVTTGGDFVASTEQCVLQGFKADLPQLATEWEAVFRENAASLGWLARFALKDVPAPLDRTADKKPFSLSFSADRYVSKGDRFAFSNRDGQFEMFFGASEGKDFSFEKFGPTTFKDIQAKYNGRLFFSVVECGFAGIASPLPNRLDNEPPLGQNPFTGDFILDGGYVKDMTLVMALPDGTASPVAVKEATLAANFTEARQRMSMAVSSMTLAKELLRGGAAETAGLVPMEDVLAVLPDTLTVDGRFVMDVNSLENNEISLDLTPLALSVKDLGAFSLAVGIQGRPDMDLEKDAKCRFLEISVTDAGISEPLFALLAKQQDKTPSFLRREARMALSAVGLALQGPFADLVTHCLDFLEKPGANLTIKLEPAQPTGAEELGETMVLDPVKAGLSSSVSRPEPGKSNP